MIHHHFNNDTIAAIATPPGRSAIGIVRLSGKNAISLCSRFFKGKNLNEVPANTIIFGKLADEKGEIIDEVMVSIFRAPMSYTGEDVAEINCHGSMFILQRTLELFTGNGARQAEPGEFTLRAFLNGKLDLSQAEAVADVIDAESGAAHKLAMNQMRGGFSKTIKNLRQELVDLISLFELELDFSEEDVEFAGNDQLIIILDKISTETRKILETFRTGNAIKKGVSVVIAGKPNAGKSTLLNTLLNEERAITSDIPGTTRDFIEDTINISGVEFRLADTAGILESDEYLETKSVEKTFERIGSADLIVYLFDVTKFDLTEFLDEVGALKTNGTLIPAGNKKDKSTAENLALIRHDLEENGFEPVFISSKFEDNISELKTVLVRSLNLEQYQGNLAIVANLRHFNILSKIDSLLAEVKENISSGLSKDLITINLKLISSLMGEITGQITNDEILGNIFGRFCIGK